MDAELRHEINWSTGRERSDEKTLAMPTCPVNLGKWKYGNKLDLFGRYLYWPSAIRNVCVWRCAPDSWYHIYDYDNVQYLLTILSFSRAFCRTQHKYWHLIRPLSGEFPLEYFSYFYFTPRHHHRTPTESNNKIFIHDQSQHTCSRIDFIVSTKHQTILYIVCYRVGCYMSSQRPTFSIFNVIRVWFRGKYCDDCASDFNHRHAGNINYYFTLLTASLVGSDKSTRQQSNSQTVTVHNPSTENSWKLQDLCADFIWPRTVVAFGIRISRSTEPVSIHRYMVYLCGYRLKLRS